MDVQLKVWHRLAGFVRNPRYDGRKAWKEILKKVEGDNFFRLHGFSGPPIVWLSFGSCAVSLGLVSILFGWQRIFITAFGWCGLFAIASFWHASWCLERSFELRQQLESETFIMKREEIQLAAYVAEKHFEITKFWGTMFLVAAGACLGIEQIISKTN